VKLVETFGDHLGLAEKSKAPDIALPDTLVKIRKYSRQP
jgi:hypothetical protein